MKAPVHRPTPYCPEFVIQKNKLKFQQMNGIISPLVEKSTSGGDDFGRGTLPNNRTLF